MSTRVILLSYDPDLERVCAAAMRSCYSAHPAYELYSYTPDSGRILEGEKGYFDDERVRYFIKKALELGHLDVLEHGSLTYDLQGVSRTLTHQLVRHRLASFSQQSQRYVKVTRSFGYVRPPKIDGAERVPVQVGSTRLELTFEDLVDVTRQMEEGLVQLRKSSEDARFVRIGAATANVVMTANPREYLHIFNVRCAKDAQWEIQDVCYAMLALARVVAPTIFETLPNAAQDDYVASRLRQLDAIATRLRPTFEAAPNGTLVPVPLDGLPLNHPVESFIRKV